MNKHREIKFAGIMTVTEGTETTYSLVTSNKPKYAVWCNMPDEGVKHVSFAWHKMPENTDLETAVGILIAHYSIKRTEIADMLYKIADKWQPKVGKKTKKTATQVNIVAQTKKLSDDEAQARKDKAAAIILARVGKK